MKNKIQFFIFLLLIILMSKMEVVRAYPQASYKPASVSSVIEALQSTRNNGIKTINPSNSSNLDEVFSPTYNFFNDGNILGYELTNGIKYWTYNYDKLLPSNELNPGNYAINSANALLKVYRYNNGGNRVYNNTSTSVKVPTVDLYKSVSQNLSYAYDGYLTYSESLKGEAVNSGTLCYPNNSFYNSVNFVNTGVAYTNEEHNLMYNIANYTIEGENLVIDGYAFLTNYDNILGSNTTIEVFLADSKESVNSKISNPNDASINAYKMDVSYANSGQTPDGGKGLRYYDLTYWACPRTGALSENYADVGRDQFRAATYSPSLDNQSIYSTTQADTFQLGSSGSANDSKRIYGYVESGGMCAVGSGGSGTYIYQGGFEAKFNLNTANINVVDSNKKNIEYKVYIKIKNNKAPNKPLTSEIGVINGVQASSTLNNFSSSVDKRQIIFNGFSSTAYVGQVSNSSSDNSSIINLITFSSSQAEPKLSKTNSMTCDSNVTITSRSAFSTQNTYYSFKTKLNITPGEMKCKGACSPGGGGWTYFEPVYYVDGSATVASHSITPSEPVTITFKTASDVALGNTVVDPPAACANKDVYYSYYLFLGGVDDNTTIMETTAQSSLFNDTLAFAHQLGMSASEFTLDNIVFSEGTLDINENNVENYYKWLDSASSTDDRFSCNGDTCYITHNSYCSVKDGEVVACYDSKTGCLLDKDGNATNQNCSKNQSNYTISQRVAATVPAQTYSITRSFQTSNEENNTFQFSLKRTFEKNNRYQLINQSKHAVALTTTSPMYLHPAVYVIAYCEADETACPDEVTPAACTTSNKTEANEKIKKYYLLESHNSGELDKVKNGTEPELKTSFSGNYTEKDFQNLDSDDKAIVSTQTSFSYNELVEFYQTWNHLISSGRRFTSGNTIYSTHSSFTNNLTGITSTSGNSAIDVSKAVNATLKAGMSINAEEGSNKNWSLSIDRTYTKSSFSNSTLAYNDTTYFSPAIYTIKYSSEDTSDNNEDGYWTDTGTTAIMHENNNLKACTLKTDNDSGFQIVTANQTSQNYSGTAYCTVSCKDDIDTQFPTYKNTDAGGYYVLDGTVGNFETNFPAITVARTCVTSEINYNQFDKDKKNAEENMIKKYNIWQDYIDIHDNINGSVDSGSDTCSYSCNCSTDADGKTSCETCYADYDWQEWEIDSRNAINYREDDYDGETGSYESSTPCSGGGETYSDATSRVEKQYANMRDKAKNTYGTAKTLYANTVNSYQNCYKWNDVYGNKNDSNLEGASNSVVSPADYILFHDETPKYYYSYDDVDSKVVEGYMTPTLQSSPLLTYAKDTSTNAIYSFWNQGATTDNSYISGATDTKNSLTLPLTKCTGVTCKIDMGGSTITVSHNEYIKRLEKKTWYYTLPTVYTLVPSGKVSNTGGNSALELEENASPVNISTASGIYEYKIKIENTSDKVRDKADKYKTFENRFSQALNTGTTTYVCNYKVINDAVDSGGLKYFYRTINPANINPTGRTLGYNWNDSKGTEVANNIKETDTNYSTLTGINDRSNTNVYSFTLTPTSMQQIRHYNNTQKSSYSDWNLTCSDYGSGGYHCYSNFLTCLASGGERQQDGVDVSCNNIFGNTLDNYKSSYDLGDLNKNREALINRMNTLDGRG